MAVRRILRMGHPNLRLIAKPLPLQELESNWFKRLLADMGDTLKDYGGVGLAAPQIDEPFRVAIIEIGDTPNRYGEVLRLPMTAFINPTIEVLSEQPVEGFWEGCLSVPGLRGFVERPQHIAVSYTNTNGEAQRLTLQGFHATVFQHEFDHLDGRLYVDKVKDPALLMFEDELERHRDQWLQHPAVNQKSQSSQSKEKDEP